MAKTIELIFDGYYGEEQLPPRGHDCAGIYIVYAGRPLSKAIPESWRLLYIGRSKDLAGRPGPLHHKYKDWRSRLGNDELLYFSFADTDDEEHAEAALIYGMQPVCNDTGKDGFHYPETVIKISGQKAKLKECFTVRKTG
jgi:hypothetical protein